VDGVRDHDALALHAAAGPDLLDLGVDEQIGVAALQRPLTKRLHLLIEETGDPADLALGDPQPQALDELVDAAGRDAAHIRLLDHAHQRLLAALARLQKAGEVAALADLRDLQLDLARPGVPAPRAIAVAMRRAVLRALTVHGTDQLRNLGLHQLASDRLHGLSDHSPCSSRSTLLTTSSIVILSRPAIAGLLSSNPEKSDDHERRGGRTYIRSVRPPLTPSLGT
jgi:hypothetical protein